MARELTFQTYELEKFVPNIFAIPMADQLRIKDFLEHSQLPSELSVLRFEPSECVDAYGYPQYWTPNLDWLK
jgi:hypothetical protein